MEKEKLKKLLKKIESGKVTVEHGLEVLKFLPFEDLGFSKLDHHRSVRRGFPEVVFCEGKSPEQIERIFRKLALGGGKIIATKASPEIFLFLKKRTKCYYYEKGKIISNVRIVKKNNKRFILVISAGTADIPVAEEACTTIEIMGNRVERVFDVGVAGIHRLLKYKNLLLNANCIIVVAGMEGALASVVAGLVDKIVIAVPTSVGYGASFNGLAALLSMLNCCAPGVAVVNIDNGFGAGYLASLFISTIK